MSDHRPPQIVSKEDAARQLRQSGILVHLDEPYLLPEILEIADALLAAPVFTTAVAMFNARSLQTITALCQRGGEHMLVGASNIMSVKDLNLAVAAGAQFILSPYFDQGIGKRCETLGILYVPGVFTRDEVLQAFAAGYSLLYLYPADILGPGHVSDLLSSVSGGEIIVGSGVNESNLPAFVQAGAIAAMVEIGTLSEHDGTQTEIISNIRAMHSIWGQQGGAI